MTCSCHDPEDGSISSQSIFLGELHSTTRLLSCKCNVTYTMIDSCIGVDNNGNLYC
jgi:hypothetical protein